MLKCSRRGLLLVLASLPLFGCGGDGSEASLTGSVTYNGAPVESGSISFMPQGPGTPFGGKIVDGSYTAEKANAGKFIALISANAGDSAPRTREEAEQRRNAPSPNYIPEKAEGNSKSIDVTGGGQVLDFAITGPPRP
jgi:hypothetical protein